MCKNVFMCIRERMLHVPNECTTYAGAAYADGLDAAVREQKFSKALDIVTLYSKCNRAMTFQNFTQAKILARRGRGTSLPQHMQNFSKELHIVTSHRKYNRALTFSELLLRQTGACALRAQSVESLIEKASKAHILKSTLYSAFVKYLYKAFIFILFYLFIYLFIL